MENIDLSDLFTTKSEATDFLARLTTISEMFFQNGFNLESALKTHLGVNKSDHFMSILRTSNVNVESLSEVKDFIFILMSKISSLPVLSLTIAFEPNDQTLKLLSEWFFINMHKQMLFDISVDKNLIAGARITYNGKFFDFSIKSTFERILKEYMERLAHPDAHIVPKASLPTTPQAAPAQAQPHTAVPSPVLQPAALHQATQPVHQQPAVANSMPK
ncbi:MAG TPA: F0F1 ATP synthase subunit delta [Candidatus Saccharimonadales bacterium]|nr:F0F1 ATP synthase subunit delta [Candidatus Saccharimonadales bacterium]